jgi:uncharacterized iron-regulated protein
MIWALALLFVPSAIPQGTDAGPFALPLGDPAYKGKTAVLRPGLFDLRSGCRATVEEVAAAADGAAFVFVGESHDNAEHHRFQAEVIRALADRGRNVIVGMEMFPTSSQHALNLWTLGKVSEEEFIKQSEWESVWGFDYALYKPIFDVVRQRGLRMVGLNVPREWAAKVAREGPGALTPGERGDMPDLDLTNAEHRKLFEAMLGGAGGHMMGENVYAAQVLWDTAMAHAALKYWERTSRTAGTVFVVLAGSGHVAYGLGIEYRLRQQADLPALTIMALDSEPGEPVTVSRSLADFVLVTEWEEGKRGQ